MFWRVLLIVLLIAGNAFAQDISVRNLWTTSSPSLAGISLSNDLGGTRNITTQLAEIRLISPQYFVEYQHLFAPTRTVTGNLGRKWEFDGVTYGQDSVGTSADSQITVSFRNTYDRLELSCPRVFPNAYGVLPVAVIDVAGFDIGITGKKDDVVYSRQFARTSIGAGLYDYYRTGQFSLESRASYTFAGDSRVFQVLIETRMYPRFWPVRYAPFVSAGYQHRGFTDRSALNISDHSNAVFLGVGLNF